LIAAERKEFDMGDLGTLLLPFAIAVIVGVPIGMLLQKKAPSARWIYPGVLIAVLSVAQTRYDLWMRAISFAIGVGLVVWELRRHRARVSKSDAGLV
jgi:hypothetical protein